MQMVATAAYDVGVATPLANLVKETYQEVVQQGLAEADFSAL